MKTHCRCRHCGTRRVLRKHPDEYRLQPRCGNCGARNFRADAWMNNRNTKTMTCICAGHGRGFHYPHRRGSLWCNYQASGEWKTEEQFRRECKDEIEQ